MSCNFQTIDGKIQVFDDEGNPSQLYKDAVDKFGETTAMEVYLASQSNDFKDLFPNNTGKTQPFFSKVVEGEDDQFKAKKAWKPLLSFTETQKAFKKAYDKFKSNFDNHIATSIPTFRETQIKVGAAITNLLVAAPKVANTKLVSIKDKYLKDNKLPNTTPTYSKVNTPLFKEIADYHKSVEDDRNSPEMKESYIAFLDETKKQYEYLVAQGYKIEPWLGEGEPYGVDSNAVRKDISENKHLFYLRSKSATGDNSSNDTAETYIPFESSGITINGDDVLSNDLVRAVHDIFGHGMIANTFSTQGELNAYKTHAPMYSEKVQKALFLELVVYNAWYKENKRYAPRKIYNIPQRFLDEINQKPLVYDIGGSEGGFAKAITKTSNSDINCINVDVNEAMGKYHTKTPVKGSEFVNDASFQDYTDESGKTYTKHTPTKKADVVHESMVFQFMSPQRVEFIKEIKDNYIKEDGLLLLEEKLVPETNAQWLQNEKVKDQYKLQYYTQAEITGKAEEVLVGMRKNQTQQKDLLRDLKSNFTYVEEYWDAGNFKGYLATNSKEKRDAFLKEIGGKITSEFSSQPVYQEPKLKEVLNFITSQNQNTEPLTKEQKLELQNFSIGVLNFSTQKLIDTFFDENGMFSVNPQKLKESGLYNDYEISNLQSDVQLQQSVKSALEALKNTTEEIDLNQEEFQQKEVTNDINSFGKMTYLNPYVVQKTIAETLGGTTEQEFEEKLNDLDFPNFQETKDKEALFQEMQGYAKADVLQDVNGEIKEELVDDTAVVMPQVVKDNVNPVLIESIKTFLNIDQDILDNNPAQVEVLLQSIEDGLVSMGIDVIGMQGKTNIKPFLAKTVEFLSDPTKESFDNFIKYYDEFFEKDKTQKKTVIKTEKKDREYVRLNTVKTEEQLYNEQGLIKVEDGTYIRVNPKSLEELYAIMQTYSEKFPDENIQQYVQKEVGNMEDIINPEIGEAIFLFKTYFDVVNDAVSEATNDAVNFTGNEQYLTTEFVSDFYIEGLKEKQKDSLKWKQFYINFGINAQGLYLKNDDPLTMQTVNEFADSNLRNYSLLSKQMPNLKAVEEVEATTLQNRRDVAVNNKKTVEKFKGQIYQVTDNEVISKNGNKEFIGINNDIFEAIDTEGQLTLYAKVEKNDSQYNKFNIEQPQTELKLEDYSHLETTPEKFEEVKKNKKIIEENFDCI